MKEDFAVWLVGAKLCCVLSCGCLGVSFFIAFVLTINHKEKSSQLLKCK